MFTRDEVAKENNIRTEFVWSVDAPDIGTYFIFLTYVPLGELSAQLVHKKIDAPTFHVRQ